MINISDYINFCSKKNHNILKFKESSVDDYILLIKKLISKMQNQPNREKLFNTINQKNNTAKMVLLNLEKYFMIIYKLISINNYKIK